MTTSLDYVFALEQIGIKFGLEQIRSLLDALDRPHLAYPAIIVAGTNGKGSVTAMVERGLRAAGLRTGRYTSPHLVRLEERFALDGQPVSTKQLEESAARVEAAARKLSTPPSFFEATTAIAFDLFRDARVDVAVLEVGMGGRLDATNVVDPIGIAITAVDFDHEQYLGHTLEAIAREKAGVIKRGSVVVLAPNSDEVTQIVRQTCDAAGAALVMAAEGIVANATVVEGRTRLSLVTPRGRYDDATLALRGRHQVDNAVTAVRLLEALDRSGRLAVPAAAIATAMTDVDWPARLELMTWRGHDVLIDGAHNPAGARALVDYIRTTYGTRLPMVAGMMRDKNIDAMVATLAGAASQFIFTAPASPRAAAPSMLVETARRLVPAVPAEDSSNPLDALARALPLGTPAVVAGSLFLAGEIRAKIS